MRPKLWPICVIKFSATDQMATSQFELRPAAPEIHCSDAQINEVFSGRRFGETRLMQASGLEMCLKNPGAELFCLAQGLRHAIDDPLWH